VVALGAERGLIRRWSSRASWRRRRGPFDELAVSVSDVLARRTQLAQELPDRCRDRGAIVAIVLGISLVTTILPDGPRWVIFQSPLAIVVIAVGTVVVLASLLRGTRSR
jgi:hypothetical protein